MSLPTHFSIPDGDNIEDRTVGSKEGVEREAKVGLLNFFRQVGQIQAALI